MGLKNAGCPSSPELLDWDEAVQEGDDLLWRDGAYLRHHGKAPWSRFRETSGSSLEESATNFVQPFVWLMRWSST